MPRLRPLARCRGRCRGHYPSTRPVFFGAAARSCSGSSVRIAVAGGAWFWRDAGRFFGWRSSLAQCPAWHEAWALVVIASPGLAAAHPLLHLPLSHLSLSYLPLSHLPQRTSAVPSTLAPAACARCCAAALLCAPDPPTQCHTPTLRLARHALPAAAQPEAPARFRSLYRRCDQRAGSCMTPAATAAPAEGSERVCSTACPRGPWRGHSM